MNNKLKIAIYSGDIPSTIFIERLIKGISNTGNHVYLFGFLKRNVSYNKYVSVITYRNTKFSKAMHLLKYSSLLYLFKRKEKRALDEILKQQSQNALHHKVKCYPVLWHKPDVFHLQWAKGLKDWIWVKEFGIKLVLSLRGTQINFSPIVDSSVKAAYKTYFPKVDMFHAVSKAIALEAEKYTVKQEKIKVIYSGLHLEPLTNAIKKDDSVFNILSVGRPHSIKGYTYALDACKLLKDNGVKFKYTIIGAQGNIQLAYQIKDLGLEAEVVLSKQKPFDTVQKLMQSSNVLVLPSLTEGIANVALEAMSLQTLVLTTDCGGMTEVIQDSYNGFVVPIRNSEKLAEKLIEINTMPKNEQLKITQNALKTVKEQHNESQMLTKMFELYKNV